MEEQFSTSCIVQDEIKLLFGLEGVVQLHNERMVERAEHSSLCLRVFNLLPLDDIGLGQDFHGIELLVVLLPN